jgi:hypothetical protein
MEENPFARPMSWPKPHAGEYTKQTPWETHFLSQRLYSRLHIRGALVKGYHLFALKYQYFEWKLRRAGRLHTIRIEECRPA